VTTFTSSHGLALTVLVAVGLFPASSFAQSDGSATVRSVLRDYEVIRGALARDDGPSVAAPARRIVETVSAASGLSDTTRTRLAEASAAATRLARVRPSDLAAARREFGALSRALVTLVQETPSLGRGLHLFECPMAEGYGRWLQPSPETNNPYMGTRMLQCGRRLH